MYKKLERDREQAMIAGVLAGLANYFNHDKTLYRLLAVVGLILTGVFPGVLFYLVAWLLMPVKSSSEPITVEYEVKS